MDRELISHKLDSLQRCIHRIETRCPKNAKDLALEVDAQDIVALNLTRAIQLCVDIGAHLVAERALGSPDSMGKTFDLLVADKMLEQDLGQSLKRAVGLRNIVIHNYQTIDWEIVHAAATQHLDDFTKFAAHCVRLAGLETRRD